MQHILLSTMRRIHLMRFKEKEYHLSNKKKPTFADDGNEISSGYGIRRIETNGGFRYQVDPDRVFGKLVRKSFIDAKEAKELFPLGGLSVS